MKSRLILSLSAAAAQENATMFEGGARDPVDIDNLYKHLQAFQEAAVAHDNTRSVQHGFNQSAEYVFDTISQSGFFDVERQYFDALVYTELAKPTLTIVGADPAISLQQCEQVTGEQHYYVGCDYAGVRYGGNGTFSVEAPVSFIENPCAESGWASFTEGDVALVPISGGAASSCDYFAKGLLADAHKAGAVIFQVRRIRHTKHC
jgi:hypothetical protein